MRSLVRRPALLAACALALLAVWELAVLVRARAQAPTLGDWQAAAQVVDSEWQAGDLVVFAPAWVDPVGRQVLGHRLTLADAGRMDAAAYTRIWELSIRGAAAPELAGAGPELTRDFGAVRLRRVKTPGATVTWQLHQGAAISEVAFAPRQCVRIGGSRVFAKVPLGERLVIKAGLADVWARKENRAWAQIRVLVDGAEVGAASVGNDSGWTTIADTATTPGAHDVTVTVGTDPSRGQPQKARLEVCVAGESRTLPPWASK